MCKHQEQTNCPNNKLPVWQGGQQGTATSVQKTRRTAGEVVFG